jgi:phosphoglycolate phosphatase
MPLAGILFDKDGTLVDFDRTWGEAAYPVMHNLSAGDDGIVARLAEAMHYRIETRRFLPTSPLIGGSSEQLLAAWAEALGRVGDPKLVDELDRQFATETLRCLMPIGDPVAVLDLLRQRGHKLGLATNDAEANARAQLAVLGLDGHMDFIAGYDSGHGGKPEPGMVLAFAAALQVGPDRVALVGDTPHDLHAARAAGAVAIAVLSGPMTRDMLEPHADHVIDSIADLPALAATLA